VRFAPGHRAAGAGRGGHEACAGRAPGRLREAATACASAALAAAPIPVSTAPRRRSNRVLQASAALGTPSPHGGAPPPAQDALRGRPRSAVGPGGRMQGRSTAPPGAGSRPWAPAPRRRLGTGRAPWGGIKRGSAACGVWGSCTGTAQPNRGASCGARRRRHGRALHASPCRPGGASARCAAAPAHRAPGGSTVRPAPPPHRLRFAGQRRAGDAPSGARGGCGYAAGPGATRLLDGELAAGPKQRTMARGSSGAVRAGPNGGEKLCLL
jgi:hypothetical protein